MTLRQGLGVVASFALVLVFVSVGVSATEPVIPKASKGEACVAPVDVMRREHMDMLFHQRDRTMYQGERDARFSLTGCLECHTRKNDKGHYISINAPGEFCQSCHEFASVKMDCFQCHATTPLQQVENQ